MDKNDKPREKKRDEIDRLVKWITAANRAYFNPAVDDVSPPSDEEYDSRIERLCKLAPKHPLCDGRSVGHPISDDANKKARLPFVMGSLDKIKYGEDDKRLASWKKKYPGPYVLSDKLDGVSALLLLSSSTPRLYTRGDGREGQDVSDLLQSIDISSILKPSTSGRLSVVRGELIVTKRDFESVLRGRGANARNLVAGVVNAKTPDATVLRHVRFVAYEVLEPGSMSSARQLDTLLDEFGSAASVNHVVVPDSHLTPDTLRTHLESRRRDSPYEVDGVVVAQADRVPERRRSNANINYTNAIAFKHRADVNLAEAEVSRVTWSVSKDGLLKPVVEFEKSVSLSGANIRRATGFNAEFVKMHGLGPGARVLVTRSGDVIPHILQVVQASASGLPQMPDSEDSETAKYVAYEWTPSGKDLRLIERGIGNGNGVNKELRVRVLTHFAEKMGVEGARESTVQKLYEAGIDTPGKLIRATAEELGSGVGITTGANLRSSLDRAMGGADCLKVMRASNAFGQGFGDRKLKLITDAFPGLLSPSNTETPSVEELVTVEGVQETTARAFLRGFDAFRRFQADNAIPCTSVSTVSNSDSKSDSGTNDLDGKVFVFSGFRDKEVEKVIGARGGRVTGTVNNKTTSVVVPDGELGTQHTTKTAQARHLGVPIVEKQTLLTELGM